MLEKRIFNIVFVTENHGVGVSPTIDIDVVVEYQGEEVKIHNPSYSNEQIS